VYARGVYVAYVGGAGRWNSLKGLEPPKVEEAVDTGAVETGCLVTDSVTPGTVTFSKKKGGYVAPYGVAPLGSARRQPAASRLRFS
jgi:hypothetical protein